MEEQIQMMKKEGIFRRLVMERQDTIRAMSARQDAQGLQKMERELIAMTEKELAQNPGEMTPEQRKAYVSEGGTPHLDGQYTVFGQVIEGFDVIDKINAVDVTTNASGEKSMPIQDVIISSVTIETYKASTAEATAEASKADSKKNSSAPASSSPTVSTAEVSAAAASETVSTAQTVSTADAQQTAQASQATSEQTAATSSSTAEVSTVDTKEAA